MYLWTEVIIDYDVFLPILSIKFIIKDISEICFHKAITKLVRKLTAYGVQAKKEVNLSQINFFNWFVSTNFYPKMDHQYCYFIELNFSEYTTKGNYKIKNVNFIFCSSVDPWRKNTIPSDQSTGTSYLGFCPVNTDVKTQHRHRHDNNSPQNFGENVWRIKLTKDKNFF